MTLCLLDPNIKAKHTELQPGSNLEPKHVHHITSHHVWVHQADYTLLGTVSEGSIFKGGKCCDVQRDWKDPLAALFLVQCFKSRTLA